MEEQVMARISGSRVSQVEMGSTKKAATDGIARRCRLADPQAVHGRRQRVPGCGPRSAAQASSG